MRALRPALVTALILVSAGARAQSVVQVPCDGVLDGRPVSTLTGGAIVPWTAGIDKDDAFMTMGAAVSLHQTGPALPDDGKFAANAEHPEVVLHFFNAAPAASPQAHLQTAVGAFSVPVPAATYSKVLLFLSASYGDAALAIKMTYADQTSNTTTFTLPDWGLGKALPTNPPAFYLIAGLHKWTKAGASVDTPSHTITGVALTPASDRKLTAVEITKTTAAPWLTFWGATGVATGAVGVDAGAGDAGVADAAAEKPVPVEAGTPGADGAAGTNGAAGTGGAAGVAGGSGAAGTNGAAGTVAAAGANGAAGTIGAAGSGAPPPSRSSGGCAVSAPSRPHVVGLLLLLPLVVSARLRRRRG